jgi:hypothetical protein
MGPHALNASHHHRAIPAQTQAESKSEKEKGRLALSGPT